MRTFEWDEILEQDEFVTLTQEPLELETLRSHSCLRGGSARRPELQRSGSGGG